MCKVRLASDRTERGELRAGEAHHEILAPRWIGHPLQLCHIGTERLLDLITELRQTGIICVTHYDSSAIRHALRRRRLPVVPWLSPPSAHASAPGNTGHCARSAASARAFPLP